MSRLLFLFVFLLNANAASITINYSARLVNITQTGLNSSVPETVFAVSDFLSQFGLATEPGGTGTELPFTGSYSYEYPQAPFSGSTPNWGVYLINGFTLNGVPLVLNTAYLNIVLNAAGIDQYGITLNNATIAAGDGSVRFVNMELVVALPLGTFSSNALPADAAFIASATGSGGLFTYDVQPQGEANRRFSNNIQLSGAIVDTATPEPGSLFLGLAGIGFVAVRRALTARSITRGARR